MDNKEIERLVDKLRYDLGFTAPELLDARVSVFKERLMRLVHRHSEAAYEAGYEDGRFEATKGEEL